MSSTLCLPFSTFMSRNRKGVLTSLVIIILASYQFQGLNWKLHDQHQTIHASIRDTYGHCVETRMSRIEQSHGRPIIVFSNKSSILSPPAQATRLDVTDSLEDTVHAKSSLGVYGNEHIVGIANEPTFTFNGNLLPVPIASRVVNSSQTIFALDVMAGVLKSITHVTGKLGDCVTVEESWYAHFARPGVIVRDIYLTNNLPTPKRFDFSMYSMPDKFSLLGNFSTDEEIARARVKVWTAPLDSDDGLSVLLVHTTPFTNITLQPRVSSRKTLLLYVTTIGLEDDVNLAALAAVNQLLAMPESKDLLKEHEIAWRDLWPLDLRIPGDTLELYGSVRSAFYTGVYYFLSGRSLVTARPDITELEGAHDGHGGCYVGPLLRDAHQWPTLPSTLADLKAYILHWTKSLIHGGCKVFSPIPSTEIIHVHNFLQGLMYGFAGIHADEFGKIIFLSQSTDMPERFTIQIDNFGFNHHQVKLTIGKTSLGIKRLDLLSEAIYLSTSKNDIALLMHHSERVLKPDTGALLSHEKHDVELHWAHDDVLTHANHPVGHSHHTSEKVAKYTTEALVLIICAIVIFHGMLVYLVWKEFCVDHGGERKSWLSRFKRKTSNNDGRKDSSVGTGF
eukprot:m.90502 g.90502  ORF g.90502 m.90502 type:complete len:619 (-) comp26402_c0_seq1:19-1875(-)